MPDVDPDIRKRFEAALRKAKVEQRGARAEFTESEWAALILPGTAAGKPARVEAPKLATVFQRRQRALSTVDRGVKRLRRSDWVGELSEARRPLDEALDVIQRKVAESPREETFREAQIVLNDLGRLSGGGNQIGTRLTQQVVDELISRGQ